MRSPKKLILGLLLSSLILVAACRPSVKADIQTSTNAEVDQNKLDIHIASPAVDDGSTQAEGLKVSSTQNKAGDVFRTIYSEGSIAEKSSEVQVRPETAGLKSRDKQGEITGNLESLLASSLSAAFVAVSSTQDPIGNSDNISNSADHGDNDDDNEVEFTGIVESIGEETWTIGGTQVTITSDTEIEDDVEEGDLVKVEARLLDDESLLALEIEFVDDDDDGDDDDGDDDDGDDDDGDDDDGDDDDGDDDDGDDDDGDDDDGDDNNGDDNDGDDNDDDDEDDDDDDEDDDDDDDVEDDDDEDDDGDDD